MTEIQQHQQQHQRSDIVMISSSLSTSSKNRHNSKSRSSLSKIRTLLIPFIICGICYQIYRSVRLSLMIPNHNDEISLVSLSFFSNDDHDNNVNGLKRKRRRRRRRSSSSRNQWKEQQRNNNDNNQIKQQHVSQDNDDEVINEYNDNDNTKTKSKTKTKTKSKTKSNTNIIQKGFGVCMMLKDDNEILYEWLAYHYTMLPLIHLVIGNDLDNTQDPIDVLKRWDNIHDFSYTVLQPDDFINIYGNYTKVKNRQYHFMLNNRPQPGAQKKKKKNNDDDNNDDTEEDEENEEDEDQDEDEEDSSVVVVDNDNNKNTNTNTSTTDIIDIEFPLLDTYERRQLSHKLLVKRQNTFLTKCMEYMIDKNKELLNRTTNNNIHKHKQEIIYVALIDTDEFIVLNRWDNDYDEQLIIETNNSKKLLNGNYNDQPYITQKMYNIRKYQLPPKSSKHNNQNNKHDPITVLDMLQKFTTPTTKSTSTKSSSSTTKETTIMNTDGTTTNNTNNLTIDMPICYTMPRLLMSAVDSNKNNNTCNESIPLKQWVNDNIPNRNPYMKTMRYFHHAGKGEFKYSKYGKVMIRLSDFVNHYTNLYNSIENQNIIKRRKIRNVELPRLLPQPGNIHRPYRDICGPPRTHFASSLYYIIHYIGNWEQYSIQRPNDLRRQDIYQYKKKAYHNRGTICHVNHELHNWIYYFYNRLLHQQQQISANINDNDNDQKVQKLVQYLLGS